MAERKRERILKTLGLIGIGLYLLLACVRLLKYLSVGVFANIGDWVNWFQLIFGFILLPIFIINLVYALEKRKNK